MIDMSDSQDLASVDEKKPWSNYENIYPKPFNLINDITETQLLAKIDDSKKSIKEAEKELLDSLNSDELKNRSDLEKLICTKREKLNNMKNELSLIHDETEQEKNDRTIREVNLLNEAKKKLAEVIAEHDSIIVPPQSEKSDFSRKKSNGNGGNGQNREQIRLQKNRLANLIGTRNEDVQNAENNLNKARNMPSKYQVLLKEINNLSLEINQDVQKFNSTNVLSRNHAIIEAKIDLLKSYLEKNIENYEKFKLQGISIVTKNKIEEYDSTGNLYKIITNASQMNFELDKLDKDPPTVLHGDNIQAQIEYDFLSKFYAERNKLYSTYKISEYADINEIDEDHLKWVQEFKSELAETKSRLKELVVILKNQIFWTDIDHEKYNNLKKEILTRHITYIDENKLEEEYIKKEINFNKTTDITMDEYLQSIKYRG
jgi:hypothetical protein